MPETKIFINSFPKGGTNLTIKLLELLGLPFSKFGISSGMFLSRGNGVKRLFRKVTRGGWLSSNIVVIGIDVPTVVRRNWLVNRLARIALHSVVFGHVRYSDNMANILTNQGFQCIQVIRDPRDIAVSHAHYVSELPTHFLYRHLRRLDDWRSRLAFSITGGYVEGVGYLESIDSRSRAVEGWMRHPDVLTVRFEDLVGVEGGGSLDAQQESIQRFCAFLGIDSSPTLIEEVSGLLFGGTSTFRKGRIGSWREEFGDEHIQLFSEVAGDVLLRWGYK